jgi:DNA (cytosine-5)-methyltransferase 1
MTDEPPTANDESCALLRVNSSRADNSWLSTDDWLPTDQPLRIFSAFSGIGGFELGIKQACKAKGLPEPVIVGYSEIDKFAISVYEHNFKGVTNYGDIRKIKETELPDFDCFTAGFPCQSFSQAGQRKGFKDDRGTLFFDIVRILEAKQPKLLVLENVKGLLSHDGGRTFKTIISSLAELGYDLTWQVLDSQDFGVPQHRERIIIVGCLGGICPGQIFPVGQPE